MNNPLERIIELIGATPGIRVVEIADQLDLEVETVERALVPALADQTVSSLPVPTLAGKLIASYTLRKPVAASEQESRPPAPPAVATQPAPSPRPTAKKAPKEKQESLAVRALAFIRSQPGQRADSEALRGELKLSRFQYPSNYFRRFIEDGTLVRDGEFWTLAGNVQDTSCSGPTSRDEGKPSGQETPVVAVQACDARAPEVESRGDAVAQKSDPSGSTDLRYAIWSDGVLELRRGGQTLALLTVAERIALRSFLSVGAPA
jgi:hypothetical protein